MFAKRVRHRRNQRSGSTARVKPHQFLWILILIPMFTEFICDAFHFSSYVPPSPYSRLLVKTPTAYEEASGFSALSKDSGRINQIHKQKMRRKRREVYPEKPTEKVVIADISPEEKGGGASARLDDASDPPDVAVSFKYQTSPYSYKIDGTDVSVRRPSELGKNNDELNFRRSRGVSNNAISEKRRHRRRKTPNAKQSSDTTSSTSRRRSNVNGALFLPDTLYRGAYVLSNVRYYAQKTAAVASRVVGNRRARLSIPVRSTTENVNAEKSNRKVPRVRDRRRRREMRNSGVKNGPVPVRRRDYDGITGRSFSSVESSNRSYPSNSQIPQNFSRNRDATHEMPRVKEVPTKPFWNEKERYRGRIAVDRIIDVEILNKNPRDSQTTKTDSSSSQTYDNKIHYDTKKTKEKEDFLHPSSMESIGLSTTRERNIHMTRRKNAVRNNRNNSRPKKSRADFQSTATRGDEVVLYHGVSSLNQSKGANHARPSSRATTTKRRRNQKRRVHRKESFEETVDRVFGIDQSGKHFQHWVNQLYSSSEEHFSGAEDFVKDGTSEFVERTKDFFNELTHENGNKKSSLTPISFRGMVGSRLRSVKNLVRQEGGVNIVVTRGLSSSVKMTIALCVKLCRWIGVGGILPEPVVGLVLGGSFVCSSPRRRFRTMVSTILVLRIVAELVHEYFDSDDFPELEPNA